MGTKAQNYIYQKELERLGKDASKKRRVLESIGIESNMEFIDHDPTKDEIEQGFVIFWSDEIPDKKYARYVYEEEVSDEEYEKILLAYNNQLGKTADDKVYAVKNGWVTFMGIVLLISLIVSIFFTIRTIDILSDLTRFRF